MRGPDVCWSAVNSEHDESTEPRSFYDAPKAGDEVRQAFDEDQPSHYAIDPKDGLPLPIIDETTLDVAQPRPLAVDTLVCMADTRQFVLRGERGEIKRTFEPSEVERAPDGLYYAPAGWWGRRRVVEPMRPQCSHYARQLIDHPGDPDHKQIVRLCTARRVDYGDFLSLTDDRMHACELREPRYVTADKTLDDIDGEKIALAEQAAEENVWDIDAALAGEEQDADYSVLGPGTAEPEGIEADG